MIASSHHDEESLAGGVINHVVRSGRTVRRPVGPWTPTVHAPLGHLREAGFTGAPRAYRFVPLTGPDNRDFPLPVADQARRLRLFADAYGLDGASREALTHAAAERLERLVGHMHKQATAGVAAFARRIADGHDALYRADQVHIACHKEAFVAALLR